MRLIDADALKAKIRKAEKEFRRCKIEPDGYKMAFADGVGSTADLIVDAAPTVEERKHGCWVTGENEDDGDFIIKCSVCGKRAPTDGDYRYYLSNYCPHCGAIMDGGAYE